MSFICILEQTYNSDKYVSSRVHNIASYIKPGKINLQLMLLPAWNSKNLAIISFFIIYHMLFIIFHLQNNILHVH